MHNLIRLPNLKTLNLSDNLISKIDVDLVGLEALNLNGNQIESIPKNINKMKHLRVLRLSKNKIGSVRYIILGDLSR